MNAQGSIPADAHTFANALDDVGCSRIVCSECRGIAKSIAGWAWKVGARAEIAAVLAADLAGDDAADGALIRDATGRLYRCGCTAHIEHGKASIDRYRETGGSSVGAKWQCAGHPAPELPAIIDGVAVDPRTGNAREWVLAAIDGRPTGEARKRLARLWFELVGSEVEPQLTMAIAALVNDAEQARRDHALYFYALVPDAVGAERLGIWMSEHPEHYAASADWPSRRWVALSTTRKSVEAGRPFEPPVRDLVRGVATEPEFAELLMPLMAYHDAEWFAAHAHEFPKALHGEIRGLLPYTVPKAQRAAVIARLDAA